MSEQPDVDAGTIAVVMLRFKDYRLPRARRLLAKVNGGAVLADEDIRFLKNVYDDGTRVMPLINRHPEYATLVSKVMGLYTEIINKGIENEGLSDTKGDPK